MSRLNANATLAWSADTLLFNVFAICNVTLQMVRHFHEKEQPAMAPLVP